MAAQAVALAVAQLAGSAGAQADLSAAQAAESAGSHTPNPISRSLTTTVQSVTTFFRSFNFFWERLEGSATKNNRPRKRIASKPRGIIVNQ